jgi:hypothetical protein
LSARWSAIENFDADGDVTEEELFSQQIACFLSREYANFLAILTLGSGAIFKG